MLRVSDNWNQLSFLVNVANIKTHRTVTFIIVDRRNVQMGTWHAGIHSFKKLLSFTCLKPIWQDISQLPQKDRGLAVITPFKVQGHRFYYQSKSHMRLPIF